MINHSFWSRLAKISPNTSVRRIKMAEWVGPHKIIANFELSWL